MTLDQVLERFRVQRLRRVGAKWVIEFENGTARPASELEVALILDTER